MIVIKRKKPSGEDGFFRLFALCHFGVGHFGVKNNFGTFNIGFGTAGTTAADLNRQNLFGHIGLVFVQRLAQFRIIGRIAEFNTVGNVEILDRKSVV